MSAEKFEVIVAQTLSGTRPFETWIRKHPVTVQIVADALISELLAYVGADICKTEVGKSLGGGVYELRTRQQAQTLLKRLQWDVPPSARDLSQPVFIPIYFAIGENRRIVLLGGFNKGSLSSPRAQSSSISQARKVLGEFHEIRGRFRT